MAAMFAQTWSAEVSAMAARAKEALGEDQVEALAHVGAMQARWLAAFLVLRGVLFRKRSSDFSNRIVSIVHGVSIVVLTAMLVDWQDPFARVGRESNAQEAKALAFSLAYFSYDFVVCLFIDDDMTTHLHHVVTLAGLYVGAIQKRGGPELVVCLLISEATSPMLHLHHILKELKYKGLLSVMNDVRPHFTHWSVQFVGAVLIDFLPRRLCSFWRFSFAGCASGPSLCTTRSLPRPRPCL
mmetsp:Transcript_13064/g.32812  ORF Transcript_13064/g.32812 Transcript_13064/m.32812 type:complete len:240 (-) Transcript_13064:318-1037(-)